MRLYIVRHGIAVSHGTPGVSDEGRALTEEGIEKMRQAAKGLRSLDFIPEVILSSPLLRARQTAEILLDVLDKKIEFEISPALAPSGTRQELYREMGLHERKLLMLNVTHAI